MTNQLPMRKGVGIIVLNKNNEVFVGKRRDNPIDKWQMPQGGIDLNESPLDAMKELVEETSITQIKILKKSKIGLNMNYLQFTWKNMERKI